MKAWPSVIVSLACALPACQSDNPDHPPPAAASTSATGLAVEGAPAPPIEGTAHDGSKVNLASLKGNPVVVYFYPMDDTPGCTQEASEIRDLYEKIRQTGAVVVGVSSDDRASHVAFASKYALPFLLLSDNDGTIAKAFGVPLRMGKAKRVTFVIDRAGKIAKVFSEVNPTGHGAEIVTALSALTS
jgi:thioredoxin-dependent peroxiredoxin